MRKYFTIKTYAIFNNPIGFLDFMHSKYHNKRSSDIQHWLTSICGILIVLKYYLLHIDLTPKKRFKNFSNVGASAYAMMIIRIKLLANYLS